VKEKPTVASPFFRAFPSDRITNVTKVVNSLFTATIPVNYTNEFRELSEATLYTTHWWKGERGLLRKTCEKWANFLLL